MKVFVGVGCLLSLVGVSLACNHPSNGCDDWHGNCNSGGSGGHHGGGGGGHHGRALTVNGKGPAGENAKEKEDKLCADKEVIGQVCLAGTAMGEKMKAALDTCINIEVQVDDTDRKKKTPKRKGKNKGQKGRGGKGKGKGGRAKCPTAGEILERIDNQTSEHRCVLKEMGWVDSEGKVSLTSEVAMNDLKSLHPSILENMAQENIKNCHKVSLDELKKTSLYKKCKNKYSEEDESKIKEVISNMIFGKCSKKIFMKSCSKYVADSFMSFMEKGAIPN